MGLARLSELIFTTVLATGVMGVMGCSVVGEGFQFVLASTQDIDATPGAVLQEAINEAIDDRDFKKEEYEETHQCA